MQRAVLKENAAMVLTDERKMENLKGLKLSDIARKKISALCKEFGFITDIWNTAFQIGNFQ